MFHGIRSASPRSGIARDPRAATIRATLATSSATSSPVSVATVRLVERLARDVTPPSPEQAESHKA